MVMDRAGQLFVAKELPPRGSVRPHAVPSPSLLKSCFSISQHHELYAWKQLMSSGCIQHLSIPALGVSFVPSTLSLPWAAVPGSFSHPAAGIWGAGNAEPAHPVIP